MKPTVEQHSILYSISKLVYIVAFGRVFSQSVLCRIRRIEGTITLEELRASGHNDLEFEDYDNQAQRKHEQLWKLEVKIAGMRVLEAYHK